MEGWVPALVVEGRFLFFVGVEEVARADLQGASELEDVVEANVLLAAFDLTDEITVHLDHVPEFFLGQVAIRADGTEAYAER